jgi:hypothetical protein
MHPICPRCRTAVSVARATFLMADHSRPVILAKGRKSILASSRDE